MRFVQALLFDIMKFFNVVLLMAIFASLAPAQNAASRAVLYGGVGLDMGTTWQGMRSGNLELNPILGQNPKQHAAIVIGSAIAVDLVTRHLSRTGHGKLAAATNFSIGGLHIVAGIHNLRVAR